MVERAQNEIRQLPPRHTEKMGSRGSSNDIGRKLEDVFSNRVRVTPSPKELPDLAPDAKSGESVNCIHHWVVGPPEGDKSSGTCRKCGETRVFITKPDNYSPSRSPRPNSPAQVEPPILGD